MLSPQKKRSDSLDIDRPSSAYSTIKDLIFKRVLNPGQKLPYSDLCNLVGLSKTPIINALNRLVYEGFVVYEANKGYRIAPINKKSISHLWEIRLELESINVRNAVKNFNQCNFNVLQKKLDLLKNYTPPYTDRKKIELDMDMHLEIGGMGGNEFSQKFLKTILEHIHFMYRLERGVDRRSEAIDYEHTKIVESIGRGEIVEAERYMRQHIEALHNLMLDYLEELKQTEGSFWA